MSEQLSKNGRKQNISTEVRQYVEKRIQLLSLTITEQVSHIIAESFQRILGLFILSFALFFLWFAVGFLLAEVIGNISAGFAVASLPLFILAFVFLKTKSKSLTDKIQAQLISKVLNDLEEDIKPAKVDGEKIG